MIIYEGKELLKEVTFPGRDRGTCKGPQENVLGLVRSRGKGTWAKVEKAVSREWREGPSQACLVCRIWSWLNKTREQLAWGHTQPKVWFVYCETYILNHWKGKEKTGKERKARQGKAKLAFYFRCNKIIREKVRKFILYFPKHLSLLGVVNPSVLAELVWTWDDS